MSEDQSPAELHAEILRLRQKLAEVGDDPAKTPLTVGQQYHLSVGLAEIVAFYEEDGVQKVQTRLWASHPGDGLTPTGDASLFSTSLEHFRTLEARFERDQRLRETFQRRDTQRHEARAEAKQLTRPCLPGNKDKAE